MKPGDLRYYNYYDDDRNELRNRYYFLIKHYPTPNHYVEEFWETLTTDSCEKVRAVWLNNHTKPC